jgi:hypothetical protein
MHIDHLLYHVYSLLYAHILFYMYMPRCTVIAHTHNTHTHTTHTHTTHTHRMYVGWRCVHTRYVRTRYIHIGH